MTRLDIIDERVCENLVNLLRRGKKREVRTLVHSIYEAGPSAVALADQLVRPVMERVGRSWMVGAMDIYQKHQATHLLASCLIELIDRVSREEEGPAPLALGAASKGTFRSPKQLDTESRSRSYPVFLSDLDYHSGFLSVTSLLKDAPKGDGKVMRTVRMAENVSEFVDLDSAETRVLASQEERELLCGLAACKRKLAEALARVEGADVQGADDPQGLAEHVAALTVSGGPAQVRLGAVFRRYSELRGKLALANMRLVAHVAKRFRDRGVAYSDLLQEGFCGLLEAIDRFDLSHETKLATYATWWIRQAMQRAVAAGAYPVRLSPRHLRQLARNQEEIDLGRTGTTGEAGTLPASSSMLHCIHAATRPTVSLDSSSDFTLRQTVSDPEGDRTLAIDRDEAMDKLMTMLRPREREVLSLRYGLGDKPRLSLSQVGKVLEVSKERVRQIQARALEKLRVMAGELHLDEQFSPEAWRGSGNMPRQRLPGVLPTTSQRECRAMWPHEMSTKKPAVGNP